MMKKMRKIKGLLAAVICAVMLVGNAATVMAASGTGSLQLGDYFSVKVATQIIIGSGIKPMLESDFSGTIEDWGQVVSAGASVRAYLDYRSGAPSSTIAIPNVEFTWTFIKAGEETMTQTGSYIRIPQEYAGGIVNVEASTVGNKTWAPSKVTSKVTIS